MPYSHAIQNAPPERDRLQIARFGVIQAVAVVLARSYESRSYRKFKVLIFVFEWLIESESNK